MRATIYTYLKQKPIFFELQRFYHLKSQKQLDNLIEKLLDIDAVCVPAEIKFPVILELQSGFGPTLVRVNKEKLKKEYKTLERLLK